MAPSEREIFLNGEPYDLNGCTQLAALIERLGMKPGRIAVELNDRVVPRADYARTDIAAGDRLEIVNFVGGG